MSYPVSEEMSQIVHICQDTWIILFSQQFKSVFLLIYLNNSEAKLFLELISPLKTLKWSMNAQNLWNLAKL